MVCLIYLLCTSVLFVLSICCCFGSFSACFTVLFVYSLLICYHFYVPILFIRSVIMFIVSVYCHIFWTSSVFDIIETEGLLLEVTVRFIRSVLPREDGERD